MCALCLLASVDDFFTRPPPHAPWRIPGRGRRECPKGFRRPRLSLCARRGRPRFDPSRHRAPAHMAGLLCASNRASVSEGPAFAFYGLICLAAAVTTSRKTTFSIFVRETSALRPLVGPSLSPSPLPTPENVAECCRVSRLPCLFLLFFSRFTNPYALSPPPPLPLCENKKKQLVGN